MSHSPNVGLIADLVSELSTCTQLSVNVDWNRGALAPWQISIAWQCFCYVGRKGDKNPRARIFVNKNKAQGHNLRQKEQGKYFSIFVL
jgi:hypothetical protein